MDTAAKKLASLVEHAYRVFDVERPSSLLVCTACCMDPEDEEFILSKEQHGIHPDAVRQWLSAAWAVGDVDDVKVVKWMLPRILELLSKGDSSLDYYSNPLKRLGDTGFPRHYASDEVKLLNDFLIGYTVALVECPDVLNRIMTLDDSLAMAASANAEITPVLNRIARCPDDAIVESLIDSIGGPNPSTWLDPKAYVVRRLRVPKRVYDWYTSDEMLLRMMAYAEGTSGNLSQRQTAWEIAEVIVTISSADGSGD